MLSKIYLEITDVCNLNCSFCPGTRRPPRFISPEDFDTLTDKLVGKTEYLYLHLMGEPTLHPALGELMDIAAAKGFRLCITTNALLLPERGSVILSRAPSVYKISLSLHSAEANGFGGERFDRYVSDSIAFQRAAASLGIISVIRLWNEGEDGENSMNPLILNALRREYPDEWVPVRLGSRMAPKCYLEWGERFVWPDSFDSGIPSPDLGESRFCYAIRDHVGVLCDGTVVPCCLDRNGELALGNLFDGELDDILASERAVRLLSGFSNRRVTEELCRSCGFSARF